MKIFFKKAMSLFLSIVMLVTLTVGLDFTAFANTTDTSNENTEAVWTSISFTPASPYEIIENTNGWNDSEGAFHYNIPSLRDGDILALTDDSGNSVSYTLSSNDWCFIADGLPSISIDEISMYDEQNGLWSIGGDNYFVIEYSGMKTQVPVTIIENPVESVVFNPIKPYEITINTNGGFEGIEGDEHWVYNAPDFNEGDEIVINFKDGTSETYTYTDTGHELQFVNDNGSELYCTRNCFYYEGLGETTFEVCIDKYGKTINVPVTIIENPVDYCELVPIKPYELFEKTNGYENGDTWFYYSPSFQNGDRIIIHFNDGTSAEYIYNNFDFFNENGDSLPIYSGGFDFSGLGETTFEVRIDKYGKTINVPVTIIENPVESFTFNPAKPLEIVERTHGYENQDGVWEYNEIYFNKGDTIEINYTDATTDTFVNQYSGWGSYSFENSNGEILSVYYSSFTFSGLGETETTIGLNDYNMSVTVPVTIIEDPVESCEFVPAKPYEIMENTNGYYDGESGWYYWGPNFNNDDQFIVHLKNGTNEIYTYKDYEFKNENGDSLEIRSHSFQFNGTGETTFEIIVDDYGKTINVPVTIIENPVDFCEFVPVKNYEIIVNTHGYPTESEFNYSAPNFNDGDSIIVHMKDGTTETYLNKDYCFVNDNGDQLSCYANEFTFAGTGETTFEVRIDKYGKTINVPVTIIENPVESIAFNPVSPFTCYMNANGTETEEGYRYRPPYFRNGDEIVVNFTDGTNESYVFNVNRWDFISDTGETIDTRAEEFVFSGTGETTFEMEIPFYGMKVNVPITIVENPVDFCEFVPVKEYKIVEKTYGFSYNENEWCYCAPMYNEGDKIIIHFKDGNVDTFTFVDDRMVNENETEIITSRNDFCFNGTGETTFEMIVEDYGKSLSVPVTIIENPIESISASPAKNKALISEKYSIALFDLTINYKDGSSKTFNNLHENAEIEDEFDYAHVTAYIPNEIKVGTNEFVVEYLNKTTTSTIEAVDITPVSFKVTQVKPVENAEIWNVDDGSYECTVTYSDDTTSKYDLFIFYGGGSTEASGVLVGDYSHSFDVIHDDACSSDYDGHKLTDNCSLTFVLNETELRSNIVIDNESFTHKHTVVIDEAVPATCKESGLTEGSHCSECGEILVAQEVVPNLPHGKLNKVERNRVEPTCTKSGGYEVAYICELCGDAVMGDYIELKPTGHSYKSTSKLTRATTSADGKIVTTYKCSKCGHSYSKQTRTYYQIKTISLSATSYYYDGKVKTPTVTIKDRKGNTLKKDRDYTLSYASGRKYAGRYAIKITFKGNFYGTVTKTFDIKPKNSYITKLTATSKGFKVYWKKQSTQTSGFQIQYATDSKFTKNCKGVFATGGSTTYKSIGKLYGNKRYYVRIRSYKTVKYGGKNINIYSGWSNYKYVTTKK